MGRAQGAGVAPKMVGGCQWMAIEEKLNLHVTWLARLLVISVNIFFDAPS